MCLDLPLSLEVLRGLELPEKTSTEISGGERHGSDKDNTAERRLTSSPLSPLKPADPGLPWGRHTCPSLVLHSNWHFNDTRDR